MKLPETSIEPETSRKRVAIKKETKETREGLLRIPLIKECLASNLLSKHRTQKSCQRVRSWRTISLTWLWYRLFWIYSRELMKKKDWLWLKANENNWKPRNLKTTPMKLNGHPGISGISRLNHGRLLKWVKDVELIWKTLYMVTSSASCWEQALFLPRNLLGKFTKCYLMFASL